MSLLDPAERTRTGVRTQTEVWGAPAPEAATLFESTWRDYVFSEIWNRPGLDRRSRYWISMAGSAGSGTSPEVLEGYVRGALTLGEVTLPELREAVLQVAIYVGWSAGQFFDRCITRVADQLGLPPAPIQPLRPEPWTPEERCELGGKNFHEVMKIPPPTPTTAYWSGGIRNYVFGEVWRRPGLDQRSRRWITLVGVIDDAMTTPIRSHIYSAFAAGDATAAEMDEFCLQYAVHGSWPKASYAQAVILEMGKLVAEGRPYQG